MRGRKLIICYYISDFGYGHATRAIAIVKQLLALGDCQVIICASFPLPFLMQTLGDDQRVHFRNVRTDIGYVMQSNSLMLDSVRMINTYNQYISSFKAMVEDEICFLRENSVDLVVSDISPVPFEACDKLSIPSVGISNFTWYRAYQNMIEHRALEPLAAAYGKMDFYFALAGDAGEPWGRRGKKSFGFISRSVDLAEVHRIRNSREKKGKIIFLGIGMQITLEELERTPVFNENFLIIVSSNVKIQKDNVMRIPQGYNDSQNYIAAADLVISKAGWSTVAEAVLSQKELLIFDRKQFQEDADTIEYLRKNSLASTISWEEFIHGRIPSAELERKAADSRFIQASDQTAEISLMLKMIVM